MIVTVWKTGGVEVRRWEWKKRWKKREKEEAEETKDG